ncbi:MAG: zinc ribbon domain-containing protein [Blastocatellia bacterium]
MDLCSRKPPASRTISHSCLKAANIAAHLLILTSKAEEAGRKVIKVNPSYTSQDCSQCGSRVRKTLATREHRCVNCGFVAHRDHNSAIVIKKRGALASGMDSVGNPCEPRISTYNAPRGV